MKKKEEGTFPLRRIFFPGEKDMEYLRCSWEFRGGGNIRRMSVPFFPGRCLSFGSLRRVFCSERTNLQIGISGVPHSPTPYSTRARGAF